ncbi:MAG TPA: Gfo/Idh/MocA family oxidoreductase, partial [Gemmatimonadaceae bacterium]|nr:Gfo/Idh/MocA family oxidoreductase [Gemmatimonadaceae bacterium]
MSQTTSPDGRIASTASRPLRIAVAGGGKMGQHHIRAILKLGASVRVVAVADPSADSQKAVKALVPDAATYGTLDELLAREQEVDVVHVATAPHTHEALARTALEGGCHVYVEKPFVETAAAAQRLIALARSKGLKLCAGHQLLYEAPARQALELMPALGRIVHLESY